MVASPKGDPSDPAALVVLASIALDEGALREAARLVARLRAAAPSTAEARVLDALVNERLARPRGDWIAAGLAAVEKVQPLTPSKPLVPLWEQIAGDHLNDRPLRFPEDAAGKLSPADRFLARWAWPHPWSRGPGKDPVLVGEAVRMAGSDERPLVLLVALDVLASAEPSEGEGTTEADISRARRSGLAKLRGSPAERLRFLALAPRTEAQPVDEDEIAGIAASVAEDDPPSFGPHYSELMRILDKLDSATASLYAQTGATKFLLPPTQLLQIGDRSTRSNLSGAARQRLAAAFIRYAERLQREGLLITDMVAAVFLWNASELRWDPALRARSDAVRPAVDELHNAAECLAPLYYLPIRSMQRALAEQKPQERTFLQQVARRGLSCPEPKPQRKNVEEPSQSETPKACPDPATAPSGGR
jgi:hypothetical protein